MLMTNYFPGDAYVTDPSRRRTLLDRLLGGARWVFYADYIRLVLSCSNAARRSRFPDEAWNRSSWEVLDSMERHGARFDIEGWENVSALEAPVGFVSNHMSTTESMVLPALIRPHRPVTFVVKESLTRGRLFGPIMRSRDPVVVTRKDPRRDMVTVLEEGAKRLAAGISVVIFPEGTRQDEFRPANFNSLGVKLATKTGVKVVPIALRTDFWGNGKWFDFMKEWGPLHRDRKLRFAFGPAIDPAIDARVAHRETVDFISGKMREWALLDGRPAWEPQ